MAVAAAGLAAAVAGGLLLATSDHLVDPVAYGLEVGVMLAGAVAAGLLWSRRRPGNRVAVWLAAYGVAIAGLTLQGAGDPLLHSVGVLFDPFMFVLGYAVVFAFPEGRLSGRTERLLLLAMALYFLVDFFPWLFFSPVVSGGAPLAGCNAACPANALMIADRPGIADGVGSGMSWVVITILTATLACLAFRLATASRPRRRTLLPVYVPALLLTVPALAFHGLAAGVLHMGPDTVSAIGWVLTIGRTLLVYGFLLALLQASAFAGSTLKRLIAEIGDPDGAGIRAAVAAAFDDPTVELVFPAATAGDGRATSPIVRHGETVGALWHDPALSTDPELVAAVSQAVLLALENGRLEHELRTSRTQAADAARRKVERDLHDGAQQQLLALQISVALTRELADGDSELAARLSDIGDRLQDVVEELRDLARGVQPPLLRQFGLPTALVSAAQRTRPPAAVVADGLTRYPDDVETAVYYCCLESLQNVGKHAGPEVQAQVRISQEADVLCFEIVDDGVGCELTSMLGVGAGLTNMTERVAALRGTLTLQSATGSGMRVQGRIPLVPQH